MASTTFHDDHPFDKRCMEAARIRAKYPDRVPVICEKRPGSDVPDIDKKKYLIPSDMTMGQFMYVVRKRISLPAEKAMFIFVDNKTLLSQGAVMLAVYEKYKDADGFLYVTYCGENTFGVPEM